MTLKANSSFVQHSRLENKDVKRRLKAKPNTAAGPIQSFAIFEFQRHRWTRRVDIRKEGSAQRWELEPRMWWGFTQRACWKLAPPARRPGPAPDHITHRTLTPVASQSIPNNQHRDEAPQAQVKAECARRSSIVVSGGCDKVLRVWEVEFGRVFLCFSFIGKLGSRVASTTLVKWSGGPSSLHTSFNPPLSVPLLYPPCFSFLLSTFNPLFQFSFSRCQPLFPN
jgi:hypothetical protein